MSNYDPLPGLGAFCKNCGATAWQHPSGPPRTCPIATLSGPPLTVTKVELTQPGTVTFVGDPQAKPIEGGIYADDLEFDGAGLHIDPGGAADLGERIANALRCACGDPKCGRLAPLVVLDAAKTPVTIRIDPPVLIEGLTPTECRERWEANAAALESGMARPYSLSPEQIAEGKRLHLSAAEVARKAGK